MEDWQFDPAHDHGLSHHDRMRSLQREPGFLELLVQRLWHRFAQAYLAVWHRWEIEGLEHLPTTPPYVLVSNHTSHLDGLVLGTLVPAGLHHRLYPLAAGDYWFEGRLRPTLAGALLNALPVQRQTFRRHDWEQLRARLSEGDLIFILFPEGTRSATGELGSFKPGIGMLLAQTAVPVVPCHLSGCFSCWPRTRGMPRPGKIKVRIGAPLQFGQVPQGKAGWRDLTAQLEAAVRDLAE